MSRAADVARLAGNGQPIIHPTKTDPRKGHSMSTLTNEAPAQRDALELGDLGYETLPSGLTLEQLHAYRLGWDAAARKYLRANGGPGIVHANGQAPAAGSAAARLLAQTLAQNGRAYRTETHAIFHKAAMTRVRSYMRKAGQLEQLAALVDPLAPAKPARKSTSSRKPAAAVDVAPVVAEQPADSLAAAVASGLVTVIHVSDQQPADVAPVHVGDIAAADAGQLEQLAAQARAIGARVREDVAGDAKPVPYMLRKPLRRALADALRADELEPRGYVWDCATAAAGLVQA